MHRESNDFQVIISEIVSKQGSIINLIKIRHQEGTTSSFSETKPSVLTANILTGTVIAVQGNEIKVHFNVDSTQSPGDAMWIPYEHEVNNYMYCMPDIGDTVFVYYESEGKVIAMGSKHTNADSHPDFEHPENRSLASCNKMIKFTPKTIEFVANRKQYDGEGGNQAQIEFNKDLGICIYSTQDINIIGKNIVHLQASDEFIKIEEPPEKFDAMHDAGETKYEVDGGLTVWQQKVAAKQMARDKVREIVDSFVEEATSDYRAPIDLVSTVKDIFDIGEGRKAEDTKSEEPIERFEEGVTYLMGMQSKRFIVGDSSMTLDPININIKIPLFKLYLYTGTLY